MKRDMDLIKIIMLQAEKGKISTAIEGYRKQEILNHQKLLLDAGFLKGEPYMTREGAQPIVAMVYINEITWQGYDFLELLKDNEKFSYLKDMAKKVPLEAIKSGIKLALEGLF